MSGAEVRLTMDHQQRNNILTVLGFAAGVLALGALISVMLIFG